jgi:hypothetical protein
MMLISFRLPQIGLPLYIHAFMLLPFLWYWDRGIWYWYWKNLGAELLDQLGNKIIHRTGSPHPSHPNAAH